MIIALYAWCALVALELALQFFWNPLYYRSGIPLFNVRIPAPVALHSRLAASGLEFDVAWDGTSETTFRRLADGNIAFRDSYAVISRRYYPVMHGLVEVDARRREVRVMGRVNWNAIGLLLLLGAIVVVHPSAAPMLLILLIAVMGYWIQRRRFQAVVEAVREQLAFDHSLLPDKVAERIARSR